MQESALTPLLSFQPQIIFLRQMSKNVVLLGSCGVGFTCSILSWWWLGNSRVIPGGTKEPSGLNLVVLGGLDCTGVNLANSIPTYILDTFFKNIRKFNMKHVICKPVYNNLDAGEVVQWSLHMLGMHLTQVILEPCSHPTILLVPGIKCVTWRPWYLWGVLGILGTTGPILRLLHQPD